MNMQIEVKSPNDCESEELNNFEKIVVEAGEVQASGFRDLMLNAHRLIFRNNSPYLPNQFKK